MRDPEYSDLTAHEFRWFRLFCGDRAYEWVEENYRAKIPNNDLVQTVQTLIQFVAKASPETVEVAKMLNSGSNVVKRVLPDLIDMALEVRERFERWRDGR